LKPPPPPAVALQFQSLLVAKSGSKLKKHFGAGASGISASSATGKVSIKGAKTTMSRLAEYLAGQAGRQVVDNTALEGEYDFTGRFHGGVVNG
jgi:uncharacterized protein (TIGR03435 family)